MADVREALVALLNHPYHAPMSAHDPRDGSCQSCPWPLHEMPPEDIADAILAEFDVTERGVHNHDIDPACPETRLPDGSLRGACAISAMTAFDSPHGMWCPPGCGHDRSEAAVPAEFDAAERGEDQWWESLVEVACDKGHRIFVDDGDGGVYACPACAPPTVKPSVEDVARAMHAEVCCPCDPAGCDVQYVPETGYARAVLDLSPGRTEAEVYREGYDQGLRDAASVSRSEATVKAEALRWAASVAVADDEGIPWDDDHDRAAVSTWLLGLAARIEKGEGRG